MSKKKPYAMVQIDCDRDWDNIDISINILLEFLKIFEDNNIAATWFVVGSDLENASYKLIIEWLIKSGHEIGNHTYSHNKDFILSNVNEKKDEIVRCDQIIRQCGYTPAGFRTPFFGLDDSIAHILKELNYEYDSSICPSPFLNTIAKAKNFLNKEISADSTAASSNYGTKPPKCKLENPVEIKEIPVSVLPHIKLPAHASYAMVLPFNLCYWYSRLLINHAIRSGESLVYVFHLNDLCPKKYFKSKEFNCFMQLDKRKEFIRWICSQMSKSFNTILTRDYSDAK